MGLADASRRRCAEGLTPVITKVPPRRSRLRRWSRSTRSATAAEQVNTRHVDVQEEHPVICGQICQQTPEDGRGVDVERAAYVGDDPGSRTTDIDAHGGAHSCTRAGVRVTPDRSAAADVTSSMSQVNLLPRLLPECLAVPDAMGANTALRPIVGIEDRAAATASHPPLPLVPSLVEPARASVWASRTAKSVRARSLGGGFDMTARRLGRTPAARSRCRGYMATHQGGDQGG